MKILIIKNIPDFYSQVSFLDGNGRTGRIHNVLYSSNYINNNKSDYYQLFTSFREEDNYEDRVLYILKGLSYPEYILINYQIYYSMKFIQK